MRKLASILLVLMATATLTGCATPTLTPDLVSILEESHGLYQKGASGFSHVTTTEKVPCELGARFGSVVTMSFDTKREMLIPLNGEFVVDKGPGSSGSSAKFLSELPKVPAGSHSAALEAITQLDLQEDLVDSDHILRFFDPASGRVYYEQAFYLRGCE